MIEAAPLVTWPTLQVPVLAIVSRQNGCEELERNGAGGIPVTEDQTTPILGTARNGLQELIDAGSTVKLVRRKPEIPGDGRKIGKSNEEEVREFHQLQLNLPGDR